MIDFARAVWRKSSITQGSGDACVEVADLDTVIAARDSKNPSGPKLTFGRPAWAEFTGKVKTGQLDR